MKSIDNSVWRVKLRGHDFLVRGLFTPGYPPHWSEWDGGWPGEGPGVEIDAVALSKGKRAREIDGKGSTWDTLLEDMEQAILEDMLEESDDE